MSSPASTEMNSLVESTRASKPLRIATWNVLSETYLRKYRLRGSYRGVPEIQSRYELVRDVVLELSSRNHFVALQEVDHELVQLLGLARLPFHFVVRGPGKPDGIAWWASKDTEVRSSTFEQFPLFERSQSASRTLVARMFAIAQITVHQRAFRICCTHFESNHTKAETLEGCSTQIGAAQSEHLLARLPLQPNVIDVIVGDLNATVGDGALNTLVEHGFIPGIEQARLPRGTAAVDDNSSLSDPSRGHTQKWIDIDWVLARGATQLSVTSPLAALPLPSCQMPSDHLPLEALIH